MKTLDDRALREFLLKEVEITQNIINRMGTNSFLIKGWAITLVVASLLIRGTSYYHYVALLPWLMFWYLDAYFLRLEKLYRKLYSWLIKNRAISQEYLLDMDISNLENRFRKETPSLFEVIFSPTLLIFYILLLILIIASIFVDLWLLH
jgi:hypothetical protein